MRCANDTIDHVGVLGDNRRQCRNHGLQPLAGVEQAERHQHLAAGKIGGLPESFAPTERAIWRAMIDNHNALGINLINALQQPGRVLRHDHDPLGAFDQAFENSALLGRRVAQHRVQRHNQRRRDAIDQIKHQFAIFTAENAVFVLKPYCVDRVFVD